MPNPKIGAGAQSGSQVKGVPAEFDAIIALGTNIGDRRRNIEEAVRRLAKSGSVEIVKRSRLYRTAPWGVTDQDWFLNVCIGVATSLAPQDLLKTCQAVESDMGRVRTLHWGPRVIDIDILTYRDLAVAEPNLVIPHPLIGERGFVLVPLKEIAPELSIGGKTLEDMLGAIDASDVAVIDQ